MCTYYFSGAREDFNFEDASNKSKNLSNIGKQLKDEEDTLTK